MRAYVERRMPLLWELIMPLNSRGITLDQMKLKQFKAKRARDVLSWQRRARRHFLKEGLGELPLGPKGGFSNPKLRYLLYNKLKLPFFLNPDGDVTANKDALKSLAKQDKTGTCSILAENSLLAEARTALGVRPDPDGRVRTRFILGGDEKWDQDEKGRTSPASGRLASREPNLQNVPDWVREIYIPRKKSRLLLKCDYSQIELRLIAELSGDPALKEAIKTDAHLYIMFLVDRATGLYGLHSRGFEQLLLDYRKGDPDVVFARDETKRTDYGWGYRMGAKKLENVRGVPYQRGREALRALNNEFSYVVEWWNSLVAEVESVSDGSGYGYLTNEYGRIRHLFTEDVPKICNFKPQSLAADILFDAMVLLEKGLKDFDAELLLTVHDEVVVDAPSLDVVPFIKETMEKPIPELAGLVVPVDVMSGKNWAKYHEHNEFCQSGAGCRKPENLKGQRELKHVA